MFNPIVVFFLDFDCNDIRLIRKDGITLYCGSDVAKAFGFRDPNSAIMYHCQFVTKCLIPHPQSPVHTIEMCFLNSSDVIRLAAASKRRGAMFLAKRLTDCLTSNNDEWRRITRFPEANANPIDMSYIRMLIEETFNQEGD